jgi:hypothetical protein
MRCTWRRHWSRQSCWRAWRQSESCGRVVRCLDSSRSAEAKRSNLNRTPKFPSQPLPACPCLLSALVDVQMHRVQIKITIILYNELMITTHTAHSDERKTSDTLDTAAPHLLARESPWRRRTCTNSDDVWRSWCSDPSPMSRDVPPPRTNQIALHAIDCKLNMQILEKKIISSTLWSDLEQTYLKVDRYGAISRLRRGNLTYISILEEVRLFLTMPWCSNRCSWDERIEPITQHEK